MAQPIVFCDSACSRFRSQPPQRSNTTMSRAGSSFSIKAAIPAASLLYRCTLPACSHAASSQDLPISTPITRLSFMPSSLILMGSGTSTGLHTGEPPSLPFVPGPRNAGGPPDLHDRQDLPGPRGPAGVPSSIRKTPTTCKPGPYQTPALVTAPALQRITP